MRSRFSSSSGSVSGSLRPRSASFAPESFASASALSAVMPLPPPVTSMTSVLSRVSGMGPEAAMRQADQPRDRAAAVGAVAGFDEVRRRRDFGDHRRHRAVDRRPAPPGSGRPGRRSWSSPTGPPGAASSPGRRRRSRGAPRRTACRWARPSGPGRLRGTARRARRRSRWAGRAARPHPHRCGRVPSAAARRAGCPGWRRPATARTRCPRAGPRPGGPRAGTRPRTAGPTARCPVLRPCPPRPCGFAVCASSSIISARSPRQTVAKFGMPSSAGRLRGPG